MTTTWPRQADMDSFFGNPRGKNPVQHNPLWEIQNLVFLKPPFKMFYAGKEMPKGFRIHKKCKDSLERIMFRIWEASGKSQSVIDAWGVSTFGGSFNYRLKRGGNSLSTHSYGCAIDLDPVRNQMKDSTPYFATLPVVVRAFEDEGWTWGGRWSGANVDGMHFQYPKVK